MSDYKTNTNWIWTPVWGGEDKEQARVVLFRKTVTLDSDVQEAAIRISADTRYKLYVNGQLAEIGPSKGDRQVWFYDTVDIAPYLTGGQNVLAVAVLRYPEDPGAGNHSLFRTAVPGLYVSGNVTDAVGKVHDLGANTSWRCRVDRSVRFCREEVRFAPLMIHEEAYGNASLQGWRGVNYDDRAWDAAQEYPRSRVPEAVSPGNLQPRTIPYMYRQARRFDGVMALRQSVHTQTDWERFLAGERALTIPAHAEEIVEISAGAEMTGYIHAAFASGANADVELLYSESYVQDAVEGPEQIPVKGDRIDCAHGHLMGYRDVYHVVGYGTTAGSAGTPDAAPDEVSDVAPDATFGTASIAASDNDCELADMDAVAQGLAENGTSNLRILAGIASKNAGSGAETYDPFWFRTFRFLRLTIRTQDAPLTLQSLTYEETGYPLETRTTVTTSDESHRGIWEISERTLRRCMQETYTDCPFYEQLQYIMDARNQILYTYAISADDRLARKCLDDLRRSQRNDGLLNCCYLNCNPNVIPGFSIYYILILYDHMMYYGDRELIADHMPTVERILRFYETHLAPEGYVDKIGGMNEQGRFWSFIDWAQEWNDTSGMPPAGLVGPITMESLLYLYGLQHAVELSTFLGRHEDAAALEDRAKAVQAALRQHCIGENGMLQDGPGIDQYSQQCQVFAILTRTVDPETGKRNLLRTIEEPGYTQCTVAMRFYLFRALEETGLYAYTDQYWEAWRRMLRNHCTTCVESEAYARSECHGWGALILYELPSVTLGVRPAAPGYAKVRIAPVPGYLTHASGTVCTPRGDIHVSWEMVDGALQLEYQLPEGMSWEDVVGAE